MEPGGPIHKGSPIIFTISKRLLITQFSACCSELPLQDVTLARKPGGGGFRTVHGSRFQSIIVWRFGSY